MLEVMNVLSKHDQIEMIALDQLVPADQLVRKIEKAIDFSFIFKFSYIFYLVPRSFVN